MGFSLSFKIKLHSRLCDYGSVRCGSEFTNFNFLLILTAKRQRGVSFNIVDDFYTSFIFSFSAEFKKKKICYFINTKLMKL